MGICRIALGIPATGHRWLEVDTLSEGGTNNADTTRILELAFDILDILAKYETAGPPPADEDDGA